MFWAFLHCESIRHQLWCLSIFDWLKMCFLRWLSWEHCIVCLSFNVQNTQRRLEIFKQHRRNIKISKGKQNRRTRRSRNTARLKMGTQVKSALNMCHRNILKVTNVYWIISISVEFVCVLTYKYMFLSSVSRRYEFIMSYLRIISFNEWNNKILRVNCILSICVCCVCVRVYEYMVYKKWEWRFLLLRYKILFYFN